MDLNGVILDVKECEALRVAAENVPRITWTGSSRFSGTIIDAPMHRNDRVVDRGLDPQDAAVLVVHLIEF